MILSMLLGEDAAIVFLSYVNVVEIFLIYSLIRVNLGFFKRLLDRFSETQKWLSEAYLIRMSEALEQFKNSRKQHLQQQKRIRKPKSKRIKLEDDAPAAEIPSKSSLNVVLERPDSQTSNVSDGWIRVRSPRTDVAHLEIREAVRKGDVEAVRQQLQRADPNQPCPCNDPECLSPLWEATLSHQLDIAELLIKSGADVHESLEGKHILQVVSDLENQLEELSLTKLVAEEYQGWMLVDAVDKGRLELIDLLLEQGKDKIHETMDSMASYSFPIQLLAAQCKSAKDILPMLLKHNVNMLVKDTVGMNVLHYLIQNKHLSGQEVVELAEMLLDAGLPVDEADELFGFTPLHIAEKCGNEELVSLLIVRGAKINKKSNAGISPLDLRHQRVTDWDDLTQKNLRFDLEDQ